MKNPDHRTKINFNPHRIQGLALGLALLASAQISQAYPYASQLTNNAGTIRFTLNENADSVKVSFDNGASTNDLGALTKGSQSFAPGTHTNYAIIVFKAGTGVPTQLSADTNSLVNFNSPRGVAVNLNAHSRNFGRTFMSLTAPRAQPR